jgi:hypothetical protein
MYAVLVFAAVRLASTALAHDLAWGPADAGAANQVAAAVVSVCAGLLLLGARAPAKAEGWVCRGFADSLLAAAVRRCVADKPSEHAFTRSSVHRDEPDTREERHRVHHPVRALLCAPHGLLYTRCSTKPVPGSICSQVSHSAVVSRRGATAVASATAVGNERHPKRGRPLCDREICATPRTVRQPPRTACPGTHCHRVPRTAR